MKILFCKKGEWIHLQDAGQRIFKIDDEYYDIQGNEIFYEEPIAKECKDSRIDEMGLEEPLWAKSVIEEEWEIDDVFGQYGFCNEQGEFVIEPQYASAYDFTNGLAAVNLNRTWYRTPEGRRYYENHFGYIDHRGKTIIGFRFDEANPFNRYGVAVVYDTAAGWMMIDQKGEEIPGTRFSYIADSYMYDDRYFTFSNSDNLLDETEGFYDTKERRVLLQPIFYNLIEKDEECIQVTTLNEQDEPRMYYCNSKGEILYPWLYGKEFDYVEIPDENLVTAVRTSEYIEADEDAWKYVIHRGKKCNRVSVYGLYTANETFLLPMEYDGIDKLSCNIWACHKDGEIMVVQTEPSDLNN